MEFLQVEGNQAAVAYTINYLIFFHSIGIDTLHNRIQAFLVLATNSFR